MERKVRETPIFRHVWNPEEGAKQKEEGGEAAGGSDK